MPVGQLPAARLTIHSIGGDPRDHAIAAAAAHHGLPLAHPPRVADIAFFAGELTVADRATLQGFLVDPLLQTATWDEPTLDDAGVAAVEVTPHPGVTDSAAAALRTACATLGVDSVDGTATGRRIEFPAGTDPAAIDELLRRVVANPVIERWADGRIEPVFHPGDDDVTAAETIAVSVLDDDGLAVLNRERAMALDPEELDALRQHFADRGREPTDVELEMIAQTWSEHCSHKTFRAAITATDGATVEPLLRRLRHATDAIAAPFVRSTFVGNAGIVSFNDGTALSLKAETHNHPSAVEPFGGSNTGVGGVIRDVVGVGHRPIAVTDILCFGPADTPLADVPAGALHPRRIIAGVVDGVADYGNKIGLANVAGAVLYDAEFTTNPLVFAGCIGIGADEAPPDGPHPGDRVVVIGGATGRDGIRGATFSSLAMDATTGEVAGASVQIGDPITEKLVIDALAEASQAGVLGSADWNALWRQPLWSAITDCGAGGLSSAIGEMAEGIGADVELTAVPLKYPGLAPWEIWLSEAQERMVLAVPPDRLAHFAAICARHGVDCTDIGSFTGDGALVVRHDGTPVVDLDTKFLHDGRPQRRLTAELPQPQRTTSGRHVSDPAATLLALLAHPNIASKRYIVARYDHQIGGATAIRPLLGPDDRGHGDGVVLAAPGDRHGIAIGIGVNPWYGLHDPEAMAESAIDEAIRNVVATGADPDRVALLDNFSWGDPLDPQVLGALVAAVDGCCAAAERYGAPFVSGKDSLNNTYTGADGKRHAVPPTLVITAVAAVPDADACVTSALTAPGNELWLIGPTADDFAGSHLDLLDGSHRLPGDGSGTVGRPDNGALERYRAIHRLILGGTVRACHDVSEGGLAVALAELCIAADLGLDIDRLPADDVATALFAETPGRLVVEVDPDDAASIAALPHATRLGVVTAERHLTLPAITSIPLEQLVAAFTSAEVSA